MQEIFGNLLKLLKSFSTLSLFWNSGSSYLLVLSTPMRQPFWLTIGFATGLIEPHACCASNGSYLWLHYTGCILARMNAPLLHSLSLSFTLSFEPTLSFICEWEISVSTCSSFQLPNQLILTIDTSPIWNEDISIDSLRFISPFTITVVTHLIDPRLPIVFTFLISDWCQQVNLHWNCNHEFQKWDFKR